ncbi:MAG: bacteriohemerythrin [Spirochaetaceae bacterium]|jgi:hemerythrin|nr:bacteriohemerythrin [Spirochaetaceae bacterium]
MTAVNKKSELVSWSSTFSVGIKLIDDQHKELLNLTNDLFNHCVGDDAEERAYFEKVIHEAVKYVKIHFATEEKIMRKTNFSGFLDHKREHEAFVLTVVEQIQAFNEGKKFTLTAFTKFLKNWILTHIALQDKQYFEYFKKVATRKSDGKLSITREDLTRYSASKSGIQGAV